MALVLVKYGTDHPVEKLKIRSAKAEDKIVLIQNGVFWALEELETPAKVYTIKDDFLARGYSEEDSKVPLITYSEFIDLLESEEKFIG
ncbi:MULTISPECIES: DsrH/TusB family sulfur relay protein [Thermotoga]|jgi:tRNA 2-thiouridine synthesizing protein B|uniref:DsrH family protein n=1 Tax=Thermotoga petrophila (strain ATCC BAA-488 / DSM 13995 / JCM 10881 / RKU-1) TaxID=390874 RepID=A5INJ0_THEP1|nr:MULTISPECIES: DsrH/TusB family sulfur metabolism protein [Thermotoga]AAZ04321.1 ACR [Thermotoga sp. RQ2]ABQ47763.1 DsrH family protein [Thermotoga petrophila RKU-1]ACB10146.1 DsrH family protein [Thermotoga sp. RQ2]